MSTLRVEAAREIQHADALLDRRRRSGDRRDSALGGFVFQLRNALFAALNSDEG
jgi:hypothetical protein